VYPIHRQQAIIINNVSRKGKEPRYAAMSQEEKNARNLRKREARQKKRVLHNKLLFVSFLLITNSVV